MLFQKIAVWSVLSKDTLGFTLEETTFKQFKRPDLKLLAWSANHRLNAELYAMLLGHLANVCFVSVTDRFLCELEPVTKGQVAKDLDTKYKHLVKGLCHVQLRRHLRREPSFWNYQPSLSQMRMVFGSRSLLPIR
ncbi:cell morphogenesis N-terminal-domain-containing protein [Suillus spraguei]|nr:cell morphogenesis N-terminal-domain-containing protein [Suillus spraguei]